MDVHAVVCPIGVVVVVVVLMGIGAEVVVLRKEHGGTKKVVVGAVAVLRGKGNIDVFVLDVVALHAWFAVIVHLHAVAQLFAGDADGAAVGEQVLGVVERVVVVAFAHYGVLAFGGVAEVDGLAGAVVAEECGVALSGGLDYFVAHGENVGAVFARSGVRLYDDAAQLVVHAGETGGVRCRGAVVDKVRHSVFEGVTCQVVGHTHYVADVVALQFKHQLQVVAKVVVRGSEAQGQLALQQASCHTSCQSHFGLVPQAHSVQGVLKGQRTVAVDAHKSVAGKMVSLFHHLEGEGTALRHPYLEPAGGVRPHG